jgi:hypothetical protein
LNNKNASKRSVSARQNVFDRNWRRNVKQSERRRVMKFFRESGKREQKDVILLVETAHVPLSIEIVEDHDLVVEIEIIVVADAIHLASSNYGLENSLLLLCTLLGAASAGLFPVGGAGGDCGLDL